jgi:glycosyltransferase involved in cell wall biosynthesis
MSIFNWINVGRRIYIKSPDIVVFCYWMAFFAPCFATIACYARTRSTKIIALVHNMIPHEPTILDKWLPKLFVKKVHGFVAMSDSVVDDINKFDNKNKPKLVSPHPIYDHYGETLTKYEASAKLGLHQNKNYVLFFGFIRQYKGLDLLINAMADQRLRDLQVKLIIAGEFYENPQPYLDLILKLGLEKSIILRNGFIPDSEVRNYFSIADIVTQPYRAATQSGVSQIAYHFEKPMLVTNVGGLADSVPDGKVGYVVDVDIIKISDALVDFFTNQRSALMVENIKIEKQRFAWSKMTDAVLSLS